MGRINEKESDRALKAQVRPGSLDVQSQQVELYPFDAFEFDQYDQEVGSPLIKLKEPWRLDARVLQDYQQDLKGVATGRFVHIDGGSPGDLTERTFDGGDKALFGYYTDVYNDNMGAEWDGEDNEANYLVLECGLMIQDGLKVKDGFIKSANYEEGSTGTYMDLSTGDVEFNDGTFRGSINVNDKFQVNSNGDMTATTGSFNEDIFVRPVSLWSDLGALLGVVFASDEFGYRKTGRELFDYIRNKASDPSSGNHDQFGVFGYYQEDGNDYPLGYLVFQSGSPAKYQVYDMNGNYRCDIIDEDSTWSPGSFTSVIFFMFAGLDDIPDFT